MNRFVFKMYRESINSQTSFGVGDDAHPYIGNFLISVADGAKGQAYTAHPDINPDLFDKSHSFETAAAGILSANFPDYQSLKEQYSDNFFTDEFDLSKDYIAAGGRKSSYFGSRLATIFLRHMLEEKFTQESLSAYMEDLNGSAQSEREQKLKTLGDFLADKLFKDMQRAAENCRLSFSGNVPAGSVSLMPTTYTGILFSETDTYVDTITIQAGDSLPYAFVTDNGQFVMKLLQGAQENARGAMTNLISADYEFDLICTYKHLEKPCAIFCASDGCFDVFNSPAEFENFMLSHLRTGLQKDDPVLVENEMREFFSSGVCIDDSSSIVFAGFGFTPEVCSKMWDRQQYLASAMHLDEPEFYDERDSFEDQLHAAKTERNKILLRRSEQFWHKSKWIRDQFIDNKRPGAAEIEADEKMKDLQSELNGLEEQLLSEVKKDWYHLQQQAAHTSEGYKRYNRNASEINNRIRANKADFLRERTFIDPIRTEYIKLIDDLSADFMKKDKGFDTFQDSFHKITEMHSRIDDFLHSWKIIYDDILSSEKELQNAKKIMLEDDSLLIGLACLYLTHELQAPNYANRSGVGTKDYTQYVVQVLTKRSAFPGTAEEDIESLIDEMEQFPAMFTKKNQVKYSEIVDSILAKRKEIADRMSYCMEKKGFRKFLDRPLSFILRCYDEHRDTLDPDFAAETEEALKQVEEEILHLSQKAAEKKQVINEYMKIYENFLVN